MDEDIRTLERELDWRHPRCLRARFRAGTPQMCIWCDHALNGEPTCDYQREWTIGERVRVRHDVVDASTTEWSFSNGLIDVGCYLGDNQIAMQPVIRDHIGTMQVMKMPEVWKPAPCACDHHDIPDVATREEYERKFGLTRELLLHTSKDSFERILLYQLYHTENVNSDGSPQRWRVNGRLQLWKTRPKDFRLPIKHGMYTYGAITPVNCHEFVTREEWAR